MNLCLNVETFGLILRQDAYFGLLTAIGNRPIKSISEMSFISTNGTRIDLLFF